MRRNFAKLTYPVIGRATTHSSISATAFSTSSNGGSGRGRSTQFRFTVDEPPQPNSSKSDDAAPLPHGHGRGRGQQAFANSDSNRPPLGRGRGFIPSPSKGDSDSTKKPNVKLPFLFVKDDDEAAAKDNNSVESESSLGKSKALTGEIFNALSGAGRGKPQQTPAEKPVAENRHIRQRPQQQQQQQQRKPPVSATVSADAAAEDKSSPRVQLSQEEKVKKAVGILSKVGDVGGRGGGEGVRGAQRGGGRRGGRGRGGRRGGFSSRGKGEGRYDDDEDDDDEDDVDLGLADAADEEKLAQKLGPKIMSELAEGFEEMSSRVLPSPLDDAYVDALHTNLLIECEPEYLMEEFGTNPDIDEKPPIPLRDALEKMKPFLMAYEGIETQEEWEEVIKETMKTVPLMKEIVDHYSGPDRVTAKQQQEELERVAETLPTSAPTSVKRFTERAVLSLKSNAGWGFDKKCQFMDKLVMEVSKQYK